MVEKLKSISRQIPWYLVLKAVLVGFIWLFTPSVFPFWLFLVVVLGLYFVPMFQPLKMGLVFLIFLGFTSLLEVNPLTALLLSAMFFLVLGIKDFVLINRARSFELLVYLYIVTSSLQFFGWFVGPFAPGLLLWSVGGAIVFYILCNQAVSLAVESASKETEEKRNPEHRMVPVLLSLVLWQLTWALLFLPLSQYAAAALFTVSAVTLIDIGMQYVRGLLGRRRVLVDFSVFFAITVVVLTLMGSGF